MGSKEEVPTKPEEKIMFVEDMNENELATAVSCVRVFFLLSSCHC